VFVFWGLMNGKPSPWKAGGQKKEVGSTRIRPVSLHVPASDFTYLHLSWETHHLFRYLLSGLPLPWSSQFGVATMTSTSNDEFIPQP
jgi:hypothetical protein